jgi:hypothetical protein
VHNRTFDRSAAGGDKGASVSDAGCFTDGDALGSGGDDGEGSDSEADDGSDSDADSDGYGEEGLSWEAVMRSMQGRLR